MKLISTLVEASSESIGDLKKIISKDSRVKQVLKKTLSLEDIADKAEFLATLKFLLLNNRNVLDFVKSRNGIKNIDVHLLKDLRSLRPEKMTQSDLDNLIQFVGDLFKEHTTVQNASLSAPVRKEILDWVNANGRYFDLSHAAQRELASIPGLRPEKSVVLYRGLLFKSYDLRETSYGGRLEVGKGLKFLRSIREGTRIVDLEWDRASSWTTSKATAEQFARFGPADSSYAATLQWLGRKGKIDGDLGFIISTLAQPEDVLIDINNFKTSAHMRHGDEGEVILKPGKYTCRVHTKWTQEGEVDPVETGKVDESISEVVKAVQGFAKRWMSKIDLSEFEHGWSLTDPAQMLQRGELELFKKLVDPKLKTKILGAYQDLKDFYHQYLENLDPAVLKTLMADRKVGHIIKWVSDLHTSMDDTRAHPAFKSDKNSRGRVKKKEMSAEQVRESALSSISSRMKDATGSARFTDHSTGQFIKSLAKGLTGADHSDVHRKGAAAQRQIVDSIIDGFFEKMDLAKPEDREEALTQLRHALLAAARNGDLIRYLKDEKKSLDNAVRSEVKED